MGSGWWWLGFSLIDNEKRVVGEGFWGGGVGGNSVSCGDSTPGLDKFTLAINSLWLFLNYV